MNPVVLYDSDRFVVIHIVKNDAAVGAALFFGKPLPIPEHVFEIVDKQQEREVCLFGPWAAVFAAQTKEWQEELPEPETVERVLDGYAQLAQLPLKLH